MQPMNDGLVPEISQVDQNLQAIRTIEGSWTLPALPDEVKLSKDFPSDRVPQHLKDAAVA